MHLKIVNAPLIIVYISLIMGLSSNLAFSQKKAAKKPKGKKKTELKTQILPYNPSRTLKNDLIHTKLEVRFDWEKQYLNGTATLSFKPYFYPQNFLELDAKGMDILSIALVEKEETALKYSYDKKTITIQLPKTYTRTDTFIVKINYTAKPNELISQGSAAITDDKGLYFINPDGKDKDKPRQIWTQGETEASSCWFPTIDSPNEKTTQEMFITVDTNYTVLSNGEFIYSILNADGSKTDYWKMDKPHAPYLFMMAIGEYKIVKDTWRDMEVNYYVEPKFEKYAKAIFGNTPEMIEFFSTKLGVDYPWNKYSQVIVRDFVSGAMENTTATIFMEAVQCDDRQLLDEHWDGIIAHELFHHWFGDLVTCESWANLPLNESFANYSEYLWTEYKYGKDEADFLDMKEEEEYFDEAITKQEPLIRYHHKDREDMFDRHSYNKGGRVFHMLRNQVGDDAFFKALNLYLTRKKFQTAEIHDLRMAFEEVTGEDLNWFFNQWFLSPGHPELKITHSHKGTLLKINITQIQDTLKSPVYRLPLTVDVWVNGKKSRYPITLTKAKQEFVLPIFTSPQNIIVDAEFQLLGKIFHDKSDTELVFQYENSERYRARAAAIEKLFAQKENAPSNYNPFADSSKLNILTKALDDKFWVIRLMALYQFSKYAIPNTVENIAKIEKMALSETKPDVKAYAIALLSSYDAQKYTHVFESGINDQPYSVVSSSLKALLKSSSSNKEGQIAIHEKADNGEIACVVADYFILTKNLSKYTWFKKHMLTLQGKDLYFFMGYFGEYLKLLKGEEKSEGIKILEDISTSTKHEWIKNMAKKYLKELK